MLGDLNGPNYDWINGALFSNSYYYNKIKVNSIHTPAYFLRLDQRNNNRTLSITVHFSAVRRCYVNVRQSQCNALIFSSIFVAAETCFNSPL
jgi:hypothetical protein